MNKEYHFEYTDDGVSFIPMKTHYVDGGWDVFALSKDGTRNRGIAFKYMHTLYTAAPYDGPDDARRRKEVLRVIGAFFLFLHRTLGWASHVGRGGNRMIECRTHSTTDAFAPAQRNAADTIDYGNYLFT